MSHTSPQLRRQVFRAAILAGWLATVTWLVVTEAYPHLFSRTLHGYRALLGDVLARDEWMRVLVDGQPIGFSHASIETSDDNPAEFTRVRHEMQLELDLAGSHQPVDIELNVSLDAWQRLQRFRFALRSKAQQLFIEGQRRKADLFDVAIRTRTTHQDRSIRIPDDTVLSAMALESTLRALKPGDSVRINTLDPLTLATTPLTVSALRRERIPDGPTNVLTTVLASSVMGQQSLSWVDAQGLTRRTETALGWTLEACTMAEAFNALRSARSRTTPVDLYRQVAVPCTPAPEGATRRARYRLLGVSLDPEQVRSNRQDPVMGADGVLRLEARSSAAPDEYRRVADPPAHALAATLTLASDAPAIRAQAAAITRGLASPLAQARAIHAWVAANLRKETSIGLPTALEVLETRRGDCNEHAVLAVALARAAGIPAVTKAGLVWNRDAFYYHAWPAFFVGDWIETDPTLGLDWVGPTHLAFASGDIADHVGILRIVGRLKLELEEAE